MLNRTSQNWPTDTAHKLPASSPAPARWIVSLDKYRATWNYFTTNPSGGGIRLALLRPEGHCTG